MNNSSILVNIFNTHSDVFLLILYMKQKLLGYRYVYIQILVDDIEVFFKLFVLSANNINIVHENFH